MKTAVYPGTFDPITNGHLDVIRRALHIFDKVIVAVLENDEKKPLFTTEERLEMIKECVKGMPVGVESFSGLLADFLKKNNTKFIIRGMRAMSDFDREFQMAIVNKSLCDAETIFIMTDKDYLYLNSRLVKELARLGAPVSSLVPGCVEEALRRKFWV